jgi:hypothetical protein
MSLLQIGNQTFLTDSHIKLDILVDTQEPLSTSHHKIFVEYDEDTVSLVVEQTLSTLDMSISNNSNSSAGNASTLFEYECYRCVFFLGDPFSIIHISYTIIHTICNTYNILF